MKIAVIIFAVLAVAGLWVGPQAMRDGFNSAPKAFDAFKKTWRLDETPETIYQRHHGSK